VVAVPQPCSICTHPEREAIDAALVAGVPNRRIAAQYGMGETSVRRHKDAHIPPLVAQAHDAAVVFSADALTAQITGLLARGFAILDKSERGDSITDMCAAMREVRGVLTLIAKITGEIETQPTINIIQMPEWIEIQTVILRALAPFPEARIAVADALEVSEP
jgi:hypothetical protein